MFNWIRNLRRAKARKRPFPPEWESIVQMNVAHYCNLDAAERTELRALMQVFLEEKNWEGCGGLELTDEIRITIAAQACLLLLGLPHNYYRNVESILVYPSTVVIPERQIGVFERVSGPVEPSGPILGQAFAQGPVILVWDAVLHGARHTETGHNVVYHEFAHKLDMLDGFADGTPPLAGSDQIVEWVDVCSREFLRLRGLAEQGRDTFSTPTVRRTRPSSSPLPPKSFSIVPSHFRRTPPISTECSTPTITRIRQGGYDRWIVSTHH